ncbi:CBS domain-containing protein [Thalassolituus hydrocarboniclasticus]|uniref:CBS domain-containing protein n=1 Tax=Thalassolituus hydrocarboniclasticus TaxID=2742796 RepID=A0ABY6AEB9_9GAMM|nr:CBS domain-containing protein [Thalassolituus hydrocarboniclasticus]UXD88814.1 CBS domain-containing protein [Thalassolituus hydrocarboniclasticus]
MKLVSDLMTRELLTHLPDDTLQDAEQTMARHKIRHIPVVDNEGKVFGLLSQKEFLTEAFRITDKFGAHNLQTYLAQTKLSSCINTEVQTIAADMPLAAAGQQLRSSRQGCLLVTDSENHLIGLLSSKDFVRLAIELLEQA